MHSEQKAKCVTPNQEAYQKRQLLSWAQKKEGLDRLKGKWKSYRKSRGTNLLRGAVDSRLLLTGNHCAPAFGIIASTCPPTLPSSLLTTCPSLRETRRDEDTGRAVCSRPAALQNRTRQHVHSQPLQLSIFIHSGCSFSFYPVSC